MLPGSGTERLSPRPVQWPKSATYSTGAIDADLPVGTPNARMAADSMREIHALLAAAGVPPRGIVVRQYHPENPRHMAAIRLSYPKISAEAGPCGLWPEDIGPSVKNVSAIRAYEKAGFRFFKDTRVPDEPDPEHLMRIQRDEL